MKFSKEKIIIILTILIDVIGVGIVIPIMPYFVQNIGASAITITMLFAVFSLCSFISAPILGALSDKFGRRPALIVSLASTALGWFFFAGAHNIFMLFVGRIIDGLAAGNFPVAQSYMADLSKTDKERTSNMGMIGAIFGLGFIIGPIIGAVLSHISMAFPFWFVGILATLNTIAAIIFLPETNTNLHHDKKISFHPLTPIKSAIDDKFLRPRYLVLFLFGLAFTVQQSIFALYTQDIFNFTVSSTSYLMTFLGVIMIINQGYLLKNFWLKKFDEAKLEIWLVLILALSLLSMSYASIYTFIISIFIMMSCQSVLRTVMLSRITGLSDPKKKGEVAGIISSIMMISMIVGPVIIGFIYTFNKHLPFIISGAILFIAFLITLSIRNKKSEFKYHHEEVEPVEVI